MPDGPTEERIDIHWIYTPADFFEEKIVLNCDGYSFEIEDGHITARMSAEFFTDHPDLPDLLRHKLDLYFRGAQLIRHRVFEIDGGAYERVWPDGRRNTTLVVHRAEQVMVSDQPDLVQMDNRSVVVGDSRRDRIEATKNLAQLAVRHASNPTVKKMLASFNKSVREPEIELMRLYEVWEALAEAFGGQKAAARDALGISYSRLEALANDRHLKQGRHTGQHLGPQRDANGAELDEARKIVRQMIEKFLVYLDNQQ